MGKAPEILAGLCGAQKNETYTIALEFTGKLTKHFPGEIRYERTVRCAVPLTIKRAPDRCGWEKEMVASPRLTGGPLADWMPFRSRFTVACRPRPRADLFVPERSSRRERATFGTGSSMPIREKENCKLSTEEVYKLLERKAAEPSKSATASPTRLNNPLSLARFHEAIGLHHPLPEMRNVEVRTAQTATYPSSSPISPFALPFAKLFESPVSDKWTSRNSFRHSPAKSSPAASCKGSAKTSPIRGRSGKSGKAPLETDMDFFFASPSKPSRKQKPVHCFSPSEFCNATSPLSDSDAFLDEGLKVLDKKQKIGESPSPKKKREILTKRSKPVDASADETFTVRTRSAKSAKRQREHEDSPQRCKPSNGSPDVFATPDQENIDPESKSDIRVDSPFDAVEPPAQTTQPPRSKKPAHPPSTTSSLRAQTPFRRGDLDDAAIEDEGITSTKSSFPRRDEWALLGELEMVWGRELAQIAARVDGRCLPVEPSLDFAEGWAAEQSLADVNAGGDVETWQARIRANHRELNEVRAEEGGRKGCEGMGMEDLVDSDEEEGLGEFEEGSGTRDEGEGEE